MSEFLSQEEIDNLLGVDEEEDNSSGDVEELSLVRRFDLSSQQKIIRGKIPALDIVNDSFARQYQRTLATDLNSTVVVTPTDVKVMKMSEYLDDLLQPTSLNIVKMSPFNSGPITVVIEADLVFSAINTRYGGNKEFRYKVEGKSFHTLERDFINNMLLAIFKDYAEAWSPIIDVNLDLIYSDTNPRFDTNTSKNETVYVSKMAVSFEGGKGNVHFCIPFPVLGPYLSKLEERVKAFQGGVGSSWSDPINSSLSDTHVDMNCRVGETVMRSRDLSQAEVGDVIMFTKYDKAVITLNEQPVWIGEFGSSENGYKAVKISGAMKHPSFKS
jgi:flagellar motor switch protein FliM